MDGYNPVAGVIDVNGTLYGTTSLGGGTYGSGGVVFSFDLGTGTETVLHAFANGGRGDGETPLAGLTNVNGTLYGTTLNGGANGYGTVFTVDSGTGAESVSYSFCNQANCSDGAQPYAGLLAVNGLLYGTTDEGGAYSAGTVFSLDPSSGVETVLHSFGNRKDGQNPKGGLIAVKGTLYGTTTAGARPKHVSPVAGRSIRSTPRQIGKRSSIRSRAATDGIPRPI